MVRTGIRHSTGTIDNTVQCTEQGIRSDLRQSRTTILILHRRKCVRPNWSRTNHAVHRRLRLVHFERGCGCVLRFFYFEESSLSVGWRCGKTTSRGHRGVSAVRFPVVPPSTTTFRNTSNSWFCCYYSSSDFDRYCCLDPVSGSVIIFENNQRPIVSEVAFLLVVLVVFLFVCVCV